MAAIYGEQAQFDTDVAATRERMEAFARENAKLLIEVAAEAKENQIQVRMNESYQVYLALLKRYRDELPEKLMADLNEVVVDIYNRFNANDHPNDLIHSLRLPLKGGQSMEVAFAGDPKRWHNALAMLSEGHLRCLGMAILLAKNIKLGLPTVILDDAVNAIDHDHREGIRNTLFGHPELSKKQLIITCHSNEFIKDIETYHVKNAELYVLQPHEGDHHPLVRGGDTRNYLKQVDNCLADYNHRNALSYSRQALEGFASQLWKELKREARPLATIGVRVNGPGLPPDTRNIAEALLSSIRKGLDAGTLGEAPWRVRADSLEAILTAKINSRAWISLNKGTHEEQDQDDFEVPTVKRVTEALHALDATFG